ncbi:MAG: hypothetical protein RSF67_05420 [Clostridia bacterium]
MKNLLNEFILVIKLGFNYIWSNASIKFILLWGSLGLYIGISRIINDFRLDGSLIINIIIPITFFITMSFANHILKVWRRYVPRQEYYRDVYKETGGVFLGFYYGYPIETSKKRKYMGREKYTPWFIILIVAVTISIAILYSVIIAPIYLLLVGYGVKVGKVKTA